MPPSPPRVHYDFIVVGSGFGGSVSALRLAEKGYDVLVLEKGRRFRPEDFPRDNTDVKNWYWKPELGLKGLFTMSFFDHLTVVHGVGVGGGSLVYANTLPTPKDDFFAAPSWSHLARWKDELAPHYATAKRMLGATENPCHTPADDVARSIAEDLGRGDHFHKTEVAVYFGKPGVKVADPYFGGEGPERVGCTLCGACMTGCKVGAKNTLDRNYLYLAERRGVTVVPETEVEAVRPREGGGYRVETSPTLEGGHRGTFTADNVIFSGGVLGTVPLLLKLKADPNGLPRLSDRVGDFVRTNSEALISVLTPDQREDWSKGIAITSIVHTDEHSHFEPVRYGAGSNFFRPLLWPHAPGSSFGARLLQSFREVLRHPTRTARVARLREIAKNGTIILYMRTLEGSLKLRMGRSVLNGFRKGLVTELDPGTEAPSAFIPEATDIARRFAEKVGGIPMTLLTETVLGTPSTAHILGGACMGDSSATGVIDAHHRVFGYDGLFVIDGSAVSANPGVNPSLTITALAERAMSYVPAKA